eukprot:CAMPEP_0172451598 /NCGR_PEP_ID=MMETSP1065-20121228/9576_1 /TAXON_ID=265537 /ORGANISM="Amphiprora paludosa, Strain CCMP125" /LENGTH=136 /DNA_ID=CAMNT_0013203561 /DNA_START=289 /DNA_END=699 /DNA_ORIENTATION=+
MRAVWVETPRGRFEGFWRSPLISQRIVNVLRREAIRDGTYGEYNYESCTGWDRNWDLQTEIDRKRGQGRHRVQPPKRTLRARTRESRAQKIEKALEGMDERIEKFYADRAASRPHKDFQWHYKNIVKKGKNAPKTY